MLAAIGRGSGGRIRRNTGRQRSFADLELERQGVQLEAELAAISRLLDRRGEAILEAVASDLRRGLKKPAKGREGMSAEQALRALLLKQIKNWSFRELRERIADGLTLREFTRFGAASVPKHKAFHRASALLTPTTLAKVNALVVELAVALGLEDARRVRMDTTVSETDIHFPTDSGLLWDTVRVLTRSAARILEEIPQLPERLFNRTRAARRLCEAITHYAGLGERVVAQTRRRILQGERVPAKLFLAEGRSGVILDYQLLEGNPNDEVHVKPWLKRHVKRFGKAPAVVAGDRGFRSEVNVEHLHAHGVELECLPQQGGKKSPERMAREKSRQFKRAQKFRAGIEGRISVLVRGRGMKRCRLKGRTRFDLFLGLALAIAASMPRPAKSVPSLRDERQTRSLIVTAPGCSTRWPRAQRRRVHSPLRMASPPLSAAAVASSFISRLPSESMTPADFRERALALQAWLDSVASDVPWPPHLQAMIDRCRDDLALVVASTDADTQFLDIGRRPPPILNLGDPSDLGGGVSAAPRSPYSCGK